MITVDDAIYFGCGSLLLVLGILEIWYPSQLGSPVSEITIGAGAIAIGLHRRRDEREI